MTQTKQQPLPVEPETTPDDALPPSDTLGTIAIVEADERAFALRQREAIALSSSTMVPREYQGRDNIPNVLIAMNMAKRLNADPLMVMQNLNIIHGRPGWSAQFQIAAFNTCGRFTAIKYRFNDDRTNCTATTTERATGEMIEGTTITMAMAEAEGWTKKAGSKWKTMPEQMLRYRAASFLIRAVAPEIAMGLYTTEELEDISSNGSDG